MKIKNVIMGSAATLVAVSGARAGAAEPVLEAEPVEYVRVCDVYGAGYFYIPGTETCLRIGGYARLEIGAGEGRYGGHNDVPDPRDGSRYDTYHAYSRASFRIWTGSETEYGSLRSYIETRFNISDSVDPQPITNTLNYAWMQLGGFRVGRGDSAFLTFVGYAGEMIADDLISSGRRGGQFMSYTYSPNKSFSATLSLEQASGLYQLDGYVPHVVGGVKYSGSWGSVAGVAAYDSVWEEWATKVRLNVKASDTVSLWAMAGYGSDDNIQNSFYKPWNGNWAVWGGVAAKLTDKATLNAQLSAAEGVSTTGRDYSLALNVEYKLVKDFHIIPEITYSQFGSIRNNPNAEGLGAMIRFQRNF